MLAEALNYASEGWAVLPLKAKSKEPNFDLIKHAHLSASTDPELIKEWFAKKPNANLGISAKLSGLVILDIDFRSGGEMTDLFNETYTVKTPNGWHLYYKTAGDIKYKSPMKGVDMKYNGYVAAPPSTHPSGELYKLAKEIEPQPMSSELLREVTK
jgi:hypothetical protein